MMDSTSSITITKLKYYKTKGNKFSYIENVDLIILLLLNKML